MKYTHCKGCKGKTHWLIVSFSMGMLVMFIIFYCYLSYIKQTSYRAAKMLETSYQEVVRAKEVQVDILVADYEKCEKSSIEPQPITCK